MTSTRQNEILSRIHWNMNAAAIEQESFRIIETEAELSTSFSQPERKIARRLIHTTADLHIADSLRFRNDPVSAGLTALRNGAPLFCDSKMIRAGVSLDKLKSINATYTPAHLHCYISDADVIERARLEGKTRAICSAEKAKDMLDGSIVLIGNAPLALARIARFILEDDIRPALVIGMPVGFVNVTESKELLELCPVPQIVLSGRRGGSTLAVATLHAIMENAQQSL